jgi:hypothetical protein
MGLMRFMGFMGFMGFMVDRFMVDGFMGLMVYIANAKWF